MILIGMPVTPLGKIQVEIPAENAVPIIIEMTENGAYEITRNSIPKGVISNRI